MAEEISNISTSLERNLQQIPLEDCGKASCHVENEKGICKSSLIILLAIIILMIVIVVYFGPSILYTINSFVGTVFGNTAPAVNETMPFKQKGNEVVALGYLEPKGKTTALASPYGAETARVARLLVVEGEQIQKGQVVAELDNKPSLIAAAASAEANVVAQVAALEQVRSLIYANLAEARANRVVAEAALILASQELERQTRLDVLKATTKVMLEQAHSNSTKAQAEIERTSALIKRFEGAENDSQVDILLAVRNLDVAQVNLERARSDLSASQIVAPHDGTVLKIHSRVGEKPSETGVMMIAQTEQMAAELEVYQTDIRKIEIGQLVRLQSPALTTQLSGAVNRIGQVVERQSVMASEPAANADSRVVKIQVLLDPASSATARSFIDLEVLGKITVGPS